MKKQGSEFDRGDLIAHIQNNTPVEGPYPEGYRVPEDMVTAVVKAVPDTISQALAEFGRVEIAGFGVFVIQEREPDSGVLPDGSPWSTPQRYKIVFRPAPVFCATVSEATNMPVY